MTLTPVAPFDGEAVVALEDVKGFLKVDSSAEDTEVAALRDAAIDWVERHTAKALSRRAFVWSADRFDDRLRPCVGPIASVEQVRSFDRAGVATVLSGAAWELDGELVRLAASGAWSAARSISVELTAGYENATREAPALIAAVKLLIAHFHRNRSAVITGTIAVEAPLGVLALCSSYRSVVIG